MSDYADLKAKVSAFADGNAWPCTVQLVVDLAAAIDALERERDATLKREHDANSAAMDHKRRAEAAEARVKRLEDALLWCSGSNDFNEGGVAEKGWLKVCAPLLAAIQEDKSHE